MITVDQQGKLQRLMAMLCLLALCLTPALGSAASLVSIVSLLIAVPLAFNQRNWSSSKAKHLLAGALLSYFGYFLFLDFLITRDFGASFLAMSPNTPLLALAVIVLALDPKRAMLSASSIGKGASFAVLASAGMAGLIWLVQPSWQLLGYNLTNVSGVNGRLMLLSGNPLPFAATYMTLGFLAPMGWHDRSKTSQGFAVAALATAVSLAAVWALSRGATLAALPLAVLAIWYLRPRPKTLLAVAIGLSIVIAAMIVLGGFGERLSGSVDRLIRGVSTVASGDPSMESSTGQRLIMYRAGLAAWIESPIWGYGISQRFSAIIPYLDESYEHVRYTHLHNTFITHAVAGGLVGVFIVLVLLLTPMAINRADESSDRDQQYLAWLIFLSLAGVGMSSVILNQDVSAHFLALLMVTHLLLHHDKIASREPRDTHQQKLDEIHV